MTRAADIAVTNDPRREHGHVGDLLPSLSEVERDTMHACEAWTRLVLPHDPPFILVRAPQRGSTLRPRPPTSQ